MSYTVKIKKDSFVYTHIPINKVGELIVDLTTTHNTLFKNIKIFPTTYGYYNVIISFR